MGLSVSCFHILFMLFPLPQMLFPQFTPDCSCSFLEYQNRRTPPSTFHPSPFHIYQFSVPAPEFRSRSALYLLYINYLFVFPSPSLNCEFLRHVLSCAALSHSVVPNCLQCHGQMRLLCWWDSLGKNTGAGCHFLLQQIFPTQGFNLHLLSLLQWWADALSPHNL